MFFSILSALATPPPIVNGSTTSDYYQVGVFVQCYGNSGCADFCSGTLISPTWIITAAHCIEGLSSNDELYFLFGPNVNSYTAFGDVTTLVGHPGYPGNNSQDVYDDIGLVQIGGIYDSSTGNSVSVTPLPINTDSINSSWVNTELQMVGFGVTSTNGQDSGVKRTADMPIYEFDSDFIYLYDAAESQNICSGDSGGAALGTISGSLELVGVNSFTFGDCESWYSGVTRVDQYVSWIEQYVQDLGETPVPSEPSSETEDSENSQNENDQNGNNSNGNDQNGNNPNESDQNDHLGETGSEHSSTITEDGGQPFPDKAYGEESIPVPPACNHYSIFQNIPYQQNGQQNLSTRLVLETFWYILVSFIILIRRSM